MPEWTGRLISFRFIVGAWALYKIYRSVPVVVHFILLLSHSHLVPTPPWGLGVRGRFTKDSRVPNSNGKELGMGVGNLGF